jgi:hypothetical protein
VTTATRPSSSYGVPRYPYPSHRQRLDSTGAARSPRRAGPTCGRAKRQRRDVTLARIVPSCYGSPSSARRGHTLSLARVRERHHGGYADRLSRLLIAHTPTEPSRQREVGARGPGFPQAVTIYQPRSFRSRSWHSSPRSRSVPELAVEVAVHSDIVRKVALHDRADRARVRGKLRNMSDIADAQGRFPGVRPRPLGHPFRFGANAK